MTTRKTINKRLAAAAAIAATSLAMATPASASNPTPHPGGNPGDETRIINPDSMKPTETGDGIRIIVPDFVLNPDSMKPTEARVDDVPDRPEQAAKRARPIWR